MSVCKYCHGQGFYETMAPPKEAFFKPEITREVCLACAGVGVDPASQIATAEMRAEMDKERRAKFNETRSQKADEWDRRQARLAKERRGRDSRTQFFIAKGVPD